MDRESHLRTKLKRWLVGWGGKGLIDLIGSTMRIRFVDFENAQAELSSMRIILAFWHSRILLISYLYKGQEGAILVSSSKDGEIMAQILRRQGHQTIRGSTSRHGARALARLIRVIREKGIPGVVVPDGPRGPRFRVQPGIIALAKKTGYPIVPMTYSAKRIKVFASWDRFILPYPFTEAVVICGRPISIPAHVNTGAEESYRVRVQEELNRITVAADRYYGHRIG
jgi:lysophospholipid acyltransferase (LPLAT)-like uncharacterized protein